MKKLLKKLLTWIVRPYLYLFEAGVVIDPRIGDDKLERFTTSYLPYRNVFVGPITLIGMLYVSVSLAVPILTNEFCFHGQLPPKFLLCVGIGIFLTFTIVSHHVIKKIDQKGEKTHE